MGRASKISTSTVVNCSCRQLTLRCCGRNKERLLVGVRGVGCPPPHNFTVRRIGLGWPSNNVAFFRLLCIVTRTRSMGFAPFRSGSVSPLTATIKAALGVSIFVGVWLPVDAGQYEVLCGGSKCTVIVSPTDISSLYGRIPSKRVTYWSNSGESKTSVGTGVATTILFGGVGLLGFLAKNHQYNFTVNGFDASGKAVAMQFEFKNDKPAKLLMQEMVAVTGLGMGQSRTIDEIKAAESSDQQGLGEMPKQSTGLEPATLRPANTSSTAKASKNCWSTYLNNNPAIKKWSESNPTQAEQNKKRFDDC